MKSGPHLAATASKPPQDQCLQQRAAYGGLAGALWVPPMTMRGRLSCSRPLPADDGDGVLGLHQPVSSLALPRDTLTCATSISRNFNSSNKRTACPGVSRDTAVIAPAPPDSCPAPPGGSPPAWPRCRHEHCRGRGQMFQRLRGLAGHELDVVGPKASLLRVSSSSASPSRSRRTPARRPKPVPRTRSPCPRRCRRSRPPAPPAVGDGHASHLRLGHGHVPPQEQAVGDAPMGPAPPGAGPPLHQHRVRGSKERAARLAALSVTMLSSG